MKVGKKERETRKIKLLKQAFKLASFLGGGQRPLHTELRTRPLEEG